MEGRAICIVHSHTSLYIQFMKKLLIICAFLLAGCDNTWENRTLPVSKVRFSVHGYLEGLKLLPHRFPVSQVTITNEKSFVKAAEPILFAEYGEDWVKSQRPYAVGYADGYWMMQGYLWAAHGGEFEIIIYAKTGQVIYMTQGGK